MTPPRITATATGVRLSVHVQPRASRSGLAGIHGDALKVRISSPPVDGAANDELVRTIADAFDVPVRSVRIVAGAASRAKIVEIEGIDEARIRRIVDDG
jgi:uncharacterized protein (TIGR00251 family)